MEGGAELIGTNHALWNQYQQRFGMTFLKITEEEAEAPIVLNGTPLERGRIRAALEGDGRGAIGAERATRRRVPDAVRALDGRQRGGAGPPVARRVDWPSSPCLRSAGSASTRR